MAATKRIFISDVHIGVRGEKEWFQDKHKENLIDFLKERLSDAESGLNKG